MSSVPSGMRVMQLFCEMKATILSTRRLRGEGHVKSSWDSLSSGALGIHFFKGKSNAAQRPTLHSFCCALHGLWLEGKMLSSSASVLRGFCLIGLKAFSLHFTPRPSFHPLHRNGRRIWSFSSKEKGVQWGLAMVICNEHGEQDLKWYYLSFL